MRQRRRRPPASGWLVSAVAIIAGWVALVAHPVWPQPAPTEAPVVYVAHFTTPGCEGCKAGDRAVEEAVASLPYARLVEFDVNKHDDLEVFQVLADRAGLSAIQLAPSPSIFVLTDYMDIRYRSAEDVRRLIAKYQATGTPRFFEVTAEERANAQMVHIQRFRHFETIAVALAGLIDGINPCAFATVMFLLSYLAWLGRTRRDILLAGLFFALGIFTPYYLIGVGAMHFSRELMALPVFRHWAFELTAAGALAFALISLVDAGKARAGKSAEMTLKLPRFARSRIHQTVRETTRPGMVGGAFLAGAVCALLEAVCTGQIYLPTLIYVAGISTMRSQALLYLLLYNLAFLVPLLVVICVVYCGLSSKTVARFAEARTATVKVGLGLTFLGLAVLLHLSA